ncbi:MAG: hypothetical protein QGF21_13765 [Vicinamibacterales bacterium]|jgi:hypothetical protein|nr:hypothetical protein [Vicinamibacterales bacterium]MDP7473093.1 hypothetical protein [Vicinamibacterales bacterium]MDP7672996.1 hypothetical protein [Vicinamibacterales bacterium]HJO38678.1 hypothetical protein [Vicinamibacterales bacterium]|tara:strand:- start:588 stop:1400 length:813 start_codon:yes stop_codon:yes gene_type:complete
MRARTWLVSCLVIAVALFSAASAQAQFGAPQPAVGEVYRVELFGGLWNPTPEITISSAQLGIAGSDIDIVADLGVLQKRFFEFRAVLRPARKHKFRIHYVPITYDPVPAEATLDRSLVFNGIRYDIGIPVTTTARWDTWRFGYEYDFVYRERFFAGLILEAKYTKVEVTLDSPFAAEFIRARAAVGGIVRAYPARNWALTFEFTGFKLPESVDENYRGEYIDIDVYTTLNFTDNVGFQFGYRSLDLIYRISQDTGNVRLKGFYYGGVARF